MTKAAPSSASLPGPSDLATDAQIAALEAQLHNARLQLHGIEAISRALGSEHKLERILETVMERTTKLLHGERATLFIYDDAREFLWSKLVQGGEVETIYLRPGQGIAGWVAKQGRPVNVKDAYQDPRFDPAFDKESGFTTTSVLCAPLRDSQGQIMGVIQVLNRDHGYFSPDDEDLLGAIAAQAAISIQNSKLYLDVVGKNIDLLDTQLRLEERTAELELLFAVERAAATATTVSQALDALLETTVREFPCEAAGVVLVDAELDSLTQPCIHGDMPERLEGLPLGSGASPVEDVLSSGEAVVLNRAQRGRSERTERLRGWLDTQTEGWDAESYVCVPVTRNEERFGCLQLVNRTNDPRGFSEGDVRLLGLVGNRLALALTIARAQEEEVLAERLSTIGQMLSGVVHDLRTPLTIINGYAKLMARETETETRGEYRDLIKRQIEQLTSMTGELLAFARGDTEILLRKVFVNQFMAEISELLQQEFSGSGTNLVVENSFHGAIRMDPNKMKRLFYNLARNALDALDGQGWFRIEVAHDDEQQVRMSFTDNGPGIPAPLLGRIFEPFVTHGKKNGTGLGLALVKNIVDEHGGQVTVASTPGEGTAFTVTLPAQ